MFISYNNRIFEYKIITMITEYFNPSRKNHLTLLKYLENQLTDKGDDIEMYKFGKNTQHIFRNGKYFMTINWALV